MSVMRVEAATKSYDVRIGGGLLAGCGKAIKEAVGGSAALVVTDENVGALYGQIVRASLVSAGYRIESVTIAPGEASKTPETLFALWNAMCEAGLSRSDVCVALGGGVVGDLGGFAAATYLRGISCVQLPTSLLAQIDSSIGGKTAVDLPSGKNLAGAFYQPSLVLCDTGALSSLSDAWFFDGCAEAVKCGLIADSSLFERMERDPSRAALQRNIEEIVRACLLVKRDAVQRDERDTGARMTLNFGHTFGHAIESAGAYALPHGHAVAAGMALMARFGQQCGWTPAGVSERIEALLEAMDLPTRAGGLSAQALVSALARDKKAAGGAVRTVQLAGVGSCFLRDIPIPQLADFLEKETCA